MYLKGIYLLNLRCFARFRISNKQIKLNSNFKIKLLKKILYGNSNGRRRVFKKKIKISYPIQNYNYFLFPLSTIKIDNTHFCSYFNFINFIYFFFLFVS